MTSIDTGQFNKWGVIAVDVDRDRTVQQVGSYRGLTSIDTGQFNKWGVIADVVDSVTTSTSTRLRICAAVVCVSRLPIKQVYIKTLCSTTSVVGTDCGGQNTYI